MLKPIHHHYLYLFGLILMAVGLPCSKFLMSLSQFVLAGNWLLEMGYAEKLKRFWNNKPAVLITSIYIIHLIGLLYSTDMQYGLKDIRIKLPLLIYPFLIASSKPISKKELNLLLHLFCATVLSICIGSFFLVIKNDITDMRETPLFISRIRFGLIACIAIFSLLRFARYFTKPLLRIAYLTGSIFILLYLIYIEAATGVIALLITAVLGLFYFGFRQKNKTVRAGFIIIAILTPVIAGMFIYSQVNDFYNNIDETKMEKLPYANENEEKYEHYPHLRFVENGNYIWSYIVRKEWNKRSSIPFDSTDYKGQPVFSTIIRYLASKNLHKDSSGLAQLNEDEIRAIENGIANERYLTENGINNRIYSWIWQIDNYRKGGNPSGNSLTQRLEFWNAALLIWKNNLLFGVGTGDVPNAYQKKYAEIDSKLAAENRLRTHNQYLTFGVAFGVIGLLWILFALLYPVYCSPFKKDYFFLTFLCVALLSFINEDTLETQAGVSFFVFFYCLFLFARDEKELLGNN